MKILITGGAGFIGSNLARYISNADSQVELIVLDDLSNGNLENLSGIPLTFHEDSILNFDSLLDISEGVDVIVHLAAIGSVPRSVAAPRPTHDTNITGTLNVLEAAKAKGVKQVISASSSSVYGGNPVLPKPELTWTRPLSPYAVSKLATEAYTNAYSTSYGINTLAFRFFNVFGPNQSPEHVYAAVIPKFLKAILRNEPIEVHGDGLQSRDFTFVDTVCDAIWQSIMNKVSNPHPVNLAFGTNTSLLQLINEIEQITKINAQIQFTPSRVGDIKASQADPTEIKRLLPEVTPVSLQVGLKQTINWFLKI